MPRPGAPFDVWLLALLALWVLAAGYGLRDPWPADEPRFALIGRDIVESGRWFIPHRGPELYAEKPPIFLWLQAASYALTGGTRSAFLLPSLLAALATLALVWDLARRLHGRRVAFWTALALLATVQFALQGRTAQIDAVLAFFTTLGLYGLLRHLLLGPAWGWYAIAGIATGLGVISKGTGFLPWLIFIPYVLARSRGMYGLAPITGSWRWSIGPILMLVPILLWALPLLWLSTQPGQEEVARYRDDLLLRQTVTRYTDAWMHHRPFWYFFVNVAPVLWLPLSLLALPAAPVWWRRIRRGDARPLLLLGWVLLVLLFFSFSPGKRGVYILPAVPALALALAPLLPGLLRRSAVQRALWIVAAAVAVLLSGASLWALLGSPEFAVRVARENGVAPWTWLLATGALAATVVALCWRRGAVAFGATLLILWSGYGLLGYPAMTDARSGVALMQRVSAAMGPGDALGIVRGPEQLLLQARGDARAFGFKAPLEPQRAEAIRWLSTSSRHWVLIQQRHLDACFLSERTLDLGWSNRRHWRLVPRAALADACRVPPQPGAAAATRHGTPSVASR